MTSSTTITNARVLTLAGANGPRRGAALADNGVIEHGHVVIRDGRFEAVGSGPAPATDGEVIDADGRVVMPTFVDCHTHACWAGQRYDEFDMKLGGASYLEILEAGGGIMSTVRAVRAADEDRLAHDLACRLERTIALGTGTIEVKSGYGLNGNAELKMLRAIRTVARRAAQIVVPTFLGAHAIDRDNPRYVDETIAETLPAVASAFPGIACDAYCEQGAWSLDDCTRLFTAAAAVGCPIRVHTDQFNSLGMTRWAVEHGARSVDHLEATRPDDRRRVADSDTIAVLLPASGFHLDDEFAAGRDLVDLGAAVALATNYNPGSAPTPSIPFTIALASRRLGLRAAEAITAATINAACVLGLDDEVGSIEPGKRADLQVLDCTDERDLGYELATPGPRLVVLRGETVHER